MAVQDALIKSLLEMVCVYYRKQAGVEEEEPEVEVRLVLTASVLPSPLYCICTAFASVLPLSCLS